MVENMANADSTVVDNSPHIPNIKGLSPATPLS
jgi:hypothetical protein